MIALLSEQNFNDSNTDGSFTMANSNSFLNPYEILLMAKENKYLRIFRGLFVFYHEMYVVYTN